MNSTPTDPLIGSTISQYSIVAKLGGGGMGVVYKATDTKLGRTVALKFLPQQWSHDEAAKQRFLREAQAASATNHRNICVIHDIEQTDDGRLYIVMAYYEGQTLKEKLDGGALPDAEALEIGSEVAEGLAKAHAQGVVHRDIKPGNLIVSDDGVKILDFGLAKFADALQLTIQGSTIGTVAYMSPEQTRGEEADARSDIWAVGVVLYQMLTGEVPFKGSHEEAVFYAIKNEPVPRLRVAGGQIPEALEALVMRALEKDPEKRYQTARELARDLRRLQGRTVPLELLTEPLPPFALPRAPEPLSRWQRVRRAVTPARAMAAVVLLVAAGVSYRWLTRPTARIPIAIAPVANRTGETELDAYRLALTRSLIQELDESPNIRVVSYRRLLEIIRRFVGVTDVSGSESLQAIAANGGARILVLPSLEYRNDTNTWLARAEFRNAETGTTANTYETEAVTSTLPKDTAHRLMASLANKIQEHFGPSGALDPVLVLFRANLGLRQRVHDLVYGRRFRVGRFRTVDAARAFEKGTNDYEQMEYFAALGAFSDAASRDDQHAITQAWLSRVLLILKRVSQAVAAGKRARQLVTADTPPAVVAFIEAVLAESQGDYGDALERYRRLASLKPDDPSAHVELADFLRRLDRNQAAVEAYHEVLRLDAGYIRPHVDLCQLYIGGVPNLPLAEQHTQTALERYGAAGDRVGEAQALLCLSEAQRKQAGKRPEARRYVAKARGIFESSDKPYNLARSHFYQGLVEYSDSNFRDAAAFFQEAASRSRDAGNRLTEALALMNLGGMYYKLGRRSEAVASYTRSRDVFNDIADERGAAEATINGASLQIDFGIEQDEPLRRLGAARATVARLGYVEFQVFAMQVEAASLTNAGFLRKARTLLNQARGSATEQHLSSRINSLTVDIAATDFLLNEYDAARELLEKLLADDPKNLKARIVLARALTRLHDIDAAKRQLDAASANIDDWAELIPVLQTALGELAFELGDLQEARAHFYKAAALWTDDVPDAASVEAKSFLGLTDARHDPTAVEKIRASVKQAKKMGRVGLEAECRVHLARIVVGQRRFEEALTALADIPLERDEPTIGPELEAQVHFWRGRALEGRGDLTGATAQANLARELVRRLQRSLPPQVRDRFASRPDIRSMLEQPTVRTRG